MESAAIICTLLAVLAMGAHGVFRKWLLNGKLFSERHLLVTQCGVATAMCVIWFVVFGAWWNTLAPENLNASVWWAALILTTAVNVLIQFANMRSSRLADASFIAPISAMTPGLVVVIAMMLGEYPSMIGRIGIGLIVVGTYAHIREGAQLREYFLPLFFWRAFRSTEGLSESDTDRYRALRWAYGGAACSTLGLVGDGLIARHGDMILAVVIQLAVLAFVYAVFLPHAAKGEKVGTGGSRWKLAVLGILFSAPFILLGIGFRLAPIADIGSLKRLAIVLTVIGSVWLLRERSGTRRIFFATIIVAGAVLVAFDPASVVTISSLDKVFLRVLP